jgi:hypothetical protein
VITLLIPHNKSQNSSRQGQALGRMFCDAVICFNLCPFAEWQLLV